MIDTSEFTENEIAKVIVNFCYKIHTTLGPGLLESAYEAVLAYELVRFGFKVVRQQKIPIVYESIKLDEGYRADLVVNDKVIVELKSIEVTAPVHKKQLLTHLRFSKKKLGLLVNFGTYLIKDGISRVANGL